MNHLIYRKKFSAAFVVALMALPNTAQADDKLDNWAKGSKKWEKTHIHEQGVIDKITDKSKWDITVGAGAGFAPKYEGSDEMEFSGMPLIDIVWNDTVYLGPDGLGAYVYQDNGISVSGGIGYDGGRDQGDSSDLRGLGDVDGALTMNVNIEYDLGFVSPYVEVEKHLGGSDGLLAQVGVQSMIPLGLITGDITANDMENMGDNDHPEGAALMFGVSADWADDNYTEEYFGVNARQSARSGYAQYDAEAGFKSINADIGVMVPVTKSWTANAMLGYSQLVGDAADSPIVKDEGQVSGGLFVSYAF
ncbi:MAG: MipA/OmpV family protein [Alphaproteobacteria bacterium]